MKRSDIEKEKRGGICQAKKTSIGGQALIEGIMMRGPNKVSMAVRNPAGEIVVENRELDTRKKPKYYRWPFFRGIFGFIDSMSFGYKCLMRSAEIAGFDEPEDSGNKDNEKKTSNDDTQRLNEVEIAEAQDSDIDLSERKADHPPVQAQASATDAGAAGKDGDKKKKDAILMNAIMIVASILGVVLALALFKYLPEGIYTLLQRAVPALGGEGFSYQLIRAIFVGVLKIFILVGYMVLVSLMKDIRRTFMYHGAEHKSIMCYERGLDLTVENVRAQRRYHPRCGTSFLVLIVIVGIIITMFIPTKLAEGQALNTLLRTLISLALLPLMMSIGYELIRVAGKYDNALTRIISAPGLLLQRITTREPDDLMIECAIVALRNVIPGDGSDDWGV